MLTQFIKQLTGNLIVITLLFLAGYFLPPNPAYIVTIEVLQWKIQISFWSIAILIVLLRFVVILVLESLTFIYSIPTKLREYKKSNQLKHEINKLSEAISYLLSGELKHTRDILLNEKFEYLEEPANNLMVGTAIKDYIYNQTPITQEYKCTKTLNILNMFLKNADTKVAYDYIAKLLQYFPNSKLIYNLALDYAEKNKDYKKFFELTDKAITHNILNTRTILDDRLEQLCIDKALLLLKKDIMNEEAREVLLWVIKHIKNHESSSMLLALLYLQDKNLKKAKKTLIQAWVHKPSVNIVNQFLHIYNQSSPDERIRKLELLLEYHPNTSYVYEAMIFEALSKNNYQLAEKYFGFIDHINESINKSLLQALMVSKNLEINHILSKIWKDLHQYNNFSLPL